MSNIEQLKEDNEKIKLARVKETIRQLDSDIEQIKEAIRKKELAIKASNLRIHSLTLMLDATKRIEIGE